ncbi:glycosyltransferase family 61 protein [Paracoccus sp. MBLB3053]|uniref:Glycosyltransferase family 61 protein n=1 Tax=Paracoccus aurantius TaxID=3073814 RepID=A0ABU2HR67_9RHOB|nr:glycosyltransferase family 61 protein [Paracoccus sp. MBLB3053]MDS9467055.1 glycosyltransferase family 61 protein [Paracoccus sp. MBLB3053]
MFRPYSAGLRRLLGRPQPDFFARAVESWQEAPAATLRFYPALALPGQIDRIRQSVFASLPDTIEALTRDGEKTEGPTVAWRFRHVDLIDGVLFSNGAELHLRPRRRRFGLAGRPNRTISGALYETWVTNRWFGSWLMDELVTWPLAEGTGRPLRTGQPPKPGSHAARYLELAGATPGHVSGDVHFDELILFGDLANNADKARRQRELRARLVKGRELQPLPGVFLLRGNSGDPRVLSNERDLADRLATERGFRVIDPLIASVDEIVDACGAARMIVGVEGSQMVHGVAAAPAGAGIIPIQPPDRVAATLKQLSDRLDQRFGLVVAEGEGSAFSLDWSDLAGTLDLFE